MTKKEPKPRPRHSTAAKRTAQQQLLADQRYVEEATARADAWEARARATNKQLAEESFGPPPAPVPVVMVDGDKLAKTSKFLLSPHSIASATIKMWGLKHFGESDQKTIAVDLRDATKEISGGKMDRAEALLFTQAEALNTVFHALMMKALNNSSNFEWFKMVMPLALKAQNQSRMTLETLALVKNPPTTVFARQINNAAGPQQVNNGAAPQPRDNSSFVQPEKNPPRAHTRAYCGENQLTDERATHATMDPRGTTTPGQADRDVEAVGIVQRPKNGRGKARE